MVMADDDDDKVIACIAAVLFCTSAHLFKSDTRQHTVWVKCYIQKRPHYGMFNTLSHKRWSAVDAVAVPSNGHRNL